MLRSRILCPMALLAVCAFILASVWHTHQHGMDDHCAACQLLQVSTIEPAIGLDVDPVMVMWHTVPGIPYSPETKQSIDSNSSRAPPSYFLV
ncbi:MAG TPA: hypothetical protein VMC85_07845 [Desulfomonilaceae bacterium]|nr:hypothetical protein [Desulfomonilaceae bacterium]